MDNQKGAFMRMVEESDRQALFIAERAFIWRCTDIMARDVEHLEELKFELLKNMEKK